MITECPREAEVLEAVAFGRWPDHCAELVAHAGACAICADVAAVAQALHADREAACREAAVPAPGIVWWRATIRARAEAARTVAQPITVLQGIAGACGVGVACAAAAAAWRSLQAVRVDDLFVQLSAGQADLASASAIAMQHGLAIGLGLAACLVLAPLAIYITLTDD